MNYKPDVDYYYAFKFNGNDWGSSFDYGGRVGRINYPVDNTIAFGNNFFLFQNHGDVFNWIGNCWVSKGHFGGTPIPAGYNTIAELNPTNYTINNWNSKSFKWETNKGSYVNIGTSYKLNVGNGFQVAEYKNSTNKFVAKVNVLDGEEWINEEIPEEANDLDENPSLHPIIGTTSICGSNSFVRKCQYNWGSTGTISTLVFRRKFQDSFIKVPNTYVVSKRILKNGVNSKNITTEYSYDATGAHYNATVGIPMFNKVTVNQAGTGPIVNYFTINNEQMLGVPYKTETTVTTSENIYGIYQPVDGSWPKDVYQQRLLTTKTKKDGVLVERTIAYNNINGMPSKTTEKNSDGKCRISEASFAFENYPALKDLNMLTQPCGKKTIYSENNTEAAARIPRGAQFTMWNNFGTIIVPKWRTVNSFAWKVPMGTNGLPLPDTKYAYKDFNISSTTNPNWVLTSGSVAKYDAWGRPMDAIDINGVHSSSVLNNTTNQGVASVSYAEPVNKNETNRNIAKQAPPQIHFWGQAC